MIAWYAGCGRGCCGSRRNARASVAARTARLVAISCQNARGGAFSVLARLLSSEMKGKELVANLIVA